MAATQSPNVTAAPTSAQDAGALEGVGPSQAGKEPPVALAQPHTACAHTNQGTGFLTTSI